MRIALFGGTFDPIHAAHLAIAREAAHAVCLDRVLFVPAAHPPHKSALKPAPYEDRFRMVELAIAGESLFTASRLEAGRATSYSIDTIERAKATLAGNDNLFFLIGADAFAEIATWYRWQDVLREVEFIVVSRPGHQYEIPPHARVHRVESMALEVSSSGIRACLAAGGAPAELLPAVLDYIRARHLYRP